MLSVCIVNWNTKSFLRDCLKSLVQFPPTREEIEVIVVDNGSHDGSAQMVAEEFPDVILIAEQTNLGYAEANNVALRRAKGDVLLLLNPDVLVNAETFDKALAFLRSRPDAAAISILFRNPDGTVQPSLRGFPSPNPLMFEVLGISRQFPKNERYGAYFMRWFNYDRDMEVDQPMGTFLMVPRAAYESVGKLDTQFPIFFNEVDWCYRAKQAGWKIYFTPDAEIVHYGGQGTKQAPKRSMIRESHNSLVRFYDKHYAKSLNPIVYLAIKGAIGASCALQSLRARG